MPKRPYVICLMGPTAASKTALAIALQQALPVDIISVDSAMIYRGMDIGTAKPTEDERRIAPHQLIDILDPTQAYSAADFRSDALQAIAASIAAQRIPLLVGGTMLYFKALLQGLALLPPADIAVRKEIEQVGTSQGWQAVHHQLAQIDPHAASRIHPNDKQRLSRALEVFLLSGTTLTQLTTAQTETRLPYTVWQFALAPASKNELHSRIKQRFQHMLAAGFEQEVMSLWQRPDLAPDFPALRCVGYRQMGYYLQGKLTYQEMVEQGICATKQLAKRQMTWLKQWQDLYWLDSDKLQKGLHSIISAIH